MLETLYKWAAEVNTRGHLTSLLKGVKLTVLLNCEQEDVFLTIDNGEIDVLNHAEREEDAIISGDMEVIKEILTGRVKLRKASENNEINLDSTIRAGLLLESLFYLGYLGELAEKAEISKLLVD